MVLTAGCSDLTRGIRAGPEPGAAQRYCRTTQGPRLAAAEGSGATLPSLVRTKMRCYVAPWPLHPGKEINQLMSKPTGVHSPRPETEVLELQKELAELRRTRMKAEQRALRLPQAALAIRMAERDADAAMTGDLEELHLRITRITDELVDAWRYINNIRSNVARLNSQGFHVDKRGGMTAGPLLLEALHQEEKIRESVRGQLIDGQIRLLVPDATPLSVDAHPSSEQLADLFDQITARERNREIQRRRGGSRRSGPDGAR